MSRVEQPKYEVLSTKGGIEVRQYSPMILAEVEVSGERKDAIREGFKILADYIFGNNSSKQKIAMTAPVTTTEPSEKIAMTAPVMQEGGRDKWKVRFVMPSGYSLETLPTPHSKQIRFVEVPKRDFAVIRFSGIPGTEVIQNKTEELEKEMALQQLQPIGKPVLAFYNPPWTLPFLRRNEVMIEIE